MSLESRIKRIFTTRETFQDGYESDFSRAIILLVKDFGVDAVEAISMELQDNDVSYEALRWLGKIVDIPTHTARLNLLVKYLFNPSPLLRDGAMLGLASLGDTSAAAKLEEAIAIEPNKQTKEDMQQILEEFYHEQRRIQE